ncbi:hypothetical protein Fmac_026288 [Flemingia macrophylla]|uniref:Ycf15 n=1 Tax=Flemingia macrophylla TaxID=520843 RepID=A0ABD1LEG4_9FABA
MWRDHSGWRIGTRFADSQPLNLCGTRTPDCVILRINLPLQFQESFIFKNNTLSSSCQLEEEKSHSKWSA